MSAPRPSPTPTTWRAILASLLACAGMLAGQAHAASFTAAELGYDNAILSQFNLVNLGNYTTTNETEGRVVVGGNATINSSTNVCFKTSCTSNTAVDANGYTYGAMTVFGNLTGSGISNGNSGGSINVGGNSSGTFNLTNKGSFNVVGSALGSLVQGATTTKTTQPLFLGLTQNGPLAQTNQSLANVFPFASNGSGIASTFGTPLTNLAKGIAALPGSPGVTTQALTTGNNVFFTAKNDYTSGGKNYGVITTTLANLASEQNFGGINNGTNDATFVIVTGDGANYTLPNLNSYVGANKVIFDFVDATTLKFGGAWYGTILAPLATITANGVLDGTVVAASLNQTMELHQSAMFTGDLSGLFTTTVAASAVPEPASILLLGMGVAAVGLFRKRRRA